MNILSMWKARKHKLAVFVDGKLVFVAHKAKVEMSGTKTVITIDSDPFAGTMLAGGDELERLGIGFEELPSTPKPQAPARKIPVKTDPATKLKSRTPKIPTDRKTVKKIVKTSKKVDRVVSKPAAKRLPNGRFAPKAKAKK